MIKVALPEQDNAIDRPSVASPSVTTVTNNIVQNKLENYFSTDKKTINVDTFSAGILAFSDDKLAGYWSREQISGLTQDNN